MTTAVESIISIGKLADQCGARRDEVRSAADQAGVRTTVEIDGTPFYATKDGQRIRQHIERQRSGSNR